MAMRVKRLVRAEDLFEHFGRHDRLGDALAADVAVGEAQDVMGVLADDRRVV